MHIYDFAGKLYARSEAEVVTILIPIAFNIFGCRPDWEVVREREVCGSRAEPACE